MRYHLLAVAAMAATGWAQTAPPNITTRPFEVDVVFPGNEVYKQTEILPIVLAVQNLTEWTVGNLSMVWAWDIISYYGVYPATPGGLLASGQFQVPSDASSSTGPTYLVAITNASQWHPIHNPNHYGETYLLQWHATWYTSSDSCDTAANYRALGVFSDAVQFDVQTAEELDLLQRANETNPAVDAVIPQAPACPRFDKAARITYNAATTACQLALQTVSAAPGDPCAAKLDAAAASSISSRVASLSSSLVATRTTATPTAVRTSTSSAGAGAARPLQTAFAAACVLCGVAFS